MKIAICRHYQISLPPKSNIKELKVILYQSPLIALFKSLNPLIVDAKPLKALPKRNRTKMVPPTSTAPFMNFSEVICSRNLSIVFVSFIMRLCLIVNSNNHSKTQQ